MSKNTIIKLINEYTEEGDFSGGVSYNEIEEVESYLNVLLPSSFKWFLKKYGSGGICGVNLSGIQKGVNSSVVDDTKRYRNLGLKENYVVVEDNTEYAYCLDTSELINEECGIIKCDRFGNIYKTDYENFYEFVIDIFTEAADNWDD